MKNTKLLILTATLSGCFAFAVVDPNVRDDFFHVTVVGINALAKISNEDMNQPKRKKDES